VPHRTLGLAALWLVAQGYRSPRWPSGQPESLFDRFVELGELAWRSLPLTALAPPADALRDRRNGRRYCL